MNLQILLSACILLFSTNIANAKLKLPIGNMEKIEVVSDLPNNESYETAVGSGEHVDLARLHQEFNIAWIPIWVTEEPTLILKNAKKDEYFSLTDEQIDEIIKENKLNKYELLKLGFFTRYGGKIIVALIIILLVWGATSKSKSTE